MNGQTLVLLRNINYTNVNVFKKRTKRGTILWLRPIPSFSLSITGSVILSIIVMMSSLPMFA